MKNILIFIYLGFLSFNIYAQDNLNFYKNCNVNIENLGLLSFELGSNIDSIIPIIKEFKVINKENGTTLINFKKIVFFINSIKEIEYLLIFKNNELVKYFFETNLDKDTSIKFVEIFKKSNLQLIGKNKIKYNFSYNNEKCLFYFILVPEHPNEANLHLSFEINDKKP